MLDHTASERGVKECSTRWEPTMSRCTCDKHNHAEDCPAYGAEFDDKCESTAYVNREPVRCHLPVGHDGSHVHDGDNFVVGWEGRHDHR